MAIECKARGAGLQGQENDRVSSDSPVASSAAQRLVLALMAEKQWIPNSWDFATTFLHSKSVTLDVFVVTPIDFVVFCRPDQCSLTNSYVDNNSSLISE
jgi:hypothetical protein